MSGLFSDAEISNPYAGEKWEKVERDKALDEYFAGAHPKELGRKYKQSSRAFQNSILNKLKDNYRKPDSEDIRGRAEKYQPVQRINRTGMRMTPNELDFIRRHKELGIDPRVTAKILCRKVEEVNPDFERKARISQTKQFAPTMDVVLALRYIHFVYQDQPDMVSDATYDRLVQEEVEYGGGGAILKQYAKANIRSVPGRIKTLALYLCELFKDSKVKELPL